MNISNHRLSQNSNSRLQLTISATNVNILNAISTVNNNIGSNQSSITREFRFATIPDADIPSLAEVADLLTAIEAEVGASDRLSDDENLNSNSDNDLGSDDENLNSDSDSDPNSEFLKVFEFSEKFRRALATLNVNQYEDLSPDTVNSLGNIINRIRSIPSVRINIFTWFSNASIDDLAISESVLNRILGQLQPDPT